MTQQHCTKATITDRLGVSAKQVERYVALGMPCDGTGRARRFPWPECRNWRDELLRQQERSKLAAHQPQKIDDVRLRHEAAKAQLVELDVAERLGELIPLDTHERRISALCDLLAARVKGLGRYIGEVQMAASDIDAAMLLQSISDDLLRSLVESADEIVDEDDLVDVGPTEARA